MRTILDIFNDTVSNFSVRQCWSTLQILNDESEKNVEDSNATEQKLLLRYLSRGNENDHENRLYQLTSVLFIPCTPIK